MIASEDDILELLKFELDFIEKGGYGRSVRTPWKPTSIFQDSPTCLNFGDPDRPLPCDECFLMCFVPRERRPESVPCLSLLRTRSFRAKSNLKPSAGMAFLN